MTLLTDVLAWLSVATFAVGVGLEATGRRRSGRYVLAAGWVLFAGFWAVLVPHYLFVAKSAVETVGTALAVPACLYTAWLLVGGRDSLFVLSRAVAVAGLLYLPFETIPLLEAWLIETVTRQVAATITMLGYDPVVSTGGDAVLDTFVFTGPDGNQYRTYIVLACSGIGSMVAFAGLVAATAAPLDRKLKAFLVSVPVIWVLNIARNAFIAIAFGRQWFRGLAGITAPLFGFSDPGLASFYVADRVIAQLLAVGVLILILRAVIAQVPGLVVVVEDVLYLLTHREYDLATAFGLPPDAGRAATGASNGTVTATGDTDRGDDD